MNGVLLKQMYQSLQVKQTVGAVLSLIQRGFGFKLLILRVLI
jgi:hypothetical protein